MLEQNHDFEELKQWREISDMKIANFYLHGEKIDIDGNIHKTRKRYIKKTKLEIREHYLLTQDYAATAKEFGVNESTVRTIVKNYTRNGKLNNKRNHSVAGRPLTYPLVVIKQVNGWKISRKLQGNCKVYVKHFSGAKTKCMKDYIKPSQRENSDHYILRVRTNDLCLDRSPELIAKSIIDLALTLKNESHDVSVSNNIVRNDSDTLNKNGYEVNAVLMEMCREKNIYLIDNSKNVKPQHINKGKLHLNSDSEECISNLTLKFQKIIDCKSTLKTIRDDNLNKVIFAHLNINSIKNTFEELISQVKGTVDVLIFSETKIDDCFPIANFLIDGFSQPYRIDQDSSGGGIMLYVREDIPSNLLKVESLPIEGFYVELKLRSKNWLINCSNNPNRNAISNHIGALSDFLDFHSSTYNNIIVLSDFNVGIEEPHMKTFCENYNLQNLIEQPTCYKNLSRPTSMDLILTNVPRSFQSTCVIETGLSDFHLMTLTVMKKSFKKFQPRIINYRSYKHFSNNTFRKDLIDKLSNEELVINDDGLKRFCELSINILNKHAPRKKKYARGNQMAFFTKQLSKEIMTRSRLRNKYLRNRNEDNRALYVKQRNYRVSLLRKSKKKYYENLDERNLMDNKLF